MNQVLKKHWIKDFSLLLLLTLVVFIFFLYPSSRNFHRANLVGSYYLESGIDYEIPSPGKNQVKEIKGLHFVESVNPFFRTDIPVIKQRDNQICKGTVYLTDAEGGEWGPYIHSRMIEGEISVGNIAYINESFALDNRLYVGDHVSITLEGVKFEFTVSALFKDTMSQDESIPSIVFFSTDKEYKEIIDSYNFSGAYVGVIDDVAARDYFLNTYRPLGQIATREKYISEESYQSAVDFVLNSNYATTILDFKAIGLDILSIEEMENRGCIFLLVGVVASILFSAVLLSRRILSKGSMEIWMSLVKVGVSRGKVRGKIIFICGFDIINVIILSYIYSVCTSLLVTGDIMSVYIKYIIWYGLIMVLFSLTLTKGTVRRIFGNDACLTNQETYLQKESEDCPKEKDMCIHVECQRKNEKKR